MRAPETLSFAASTDRLKLSKPAVEPPASTTSSSTLRPRDSGCAAYGRTSMGPLRSVTSSSATHTDATFGATSVDPGGTSGQ